MRDEYSTNSCNKNGPKAAEAWEAGQRLGRWWARRKADLAALERLAAWAAGVAQSGVDPFDPDLPLGPPYSPAEQVYFALAPEAEYGDRSAVRMFWDLIGAGEFCGGLLEQHVMRGFVEGAGGVVMANPAASSRVLEEVIDHE